MNGHLQKDKIIVFDDEYYMRRALDQARIAASRGEVPVGAVIVGEQGILARAYNQVEELKDATAHAEIIAITQAASALGDWRLEDTVLYVTKEPCAMCAGAIINSRIKRLVFGMRDSRSGCAGSALDVIGHPGMLHRAEVSGGVLEDECKAVVHEFFGSVRAEKRCMTDDGGRDE